MCDSITLHSNWIKRRPKTNIANPGLLSQEDLKERPSSQSISRLQQCSWTITWWFKRIESWPRLGLFLEKHKSSWSKDLWSAVACITASWRCWLVRRRTMALYRSMSLSMHVSISVSNECLATCVLRFKEKYVLILWNRGLWVTGDVSLVGRP